MFNQTFKYQASAAVTIINAKITEKMSKKYYN